MTREKKDMGNEEHGKGKRQERKDLGKERLAAEQVFMFTHFFCDIASN